MLKYSIRAGVFASLFIVTPAFAVGLTEADFDYLTTQNVQSDGAVIRGLSPRSNQGCTF
jgi:hypothetical protein